MIHNPKEEVLVLLALKELGLATPEEVQEICEKLKMPVLPQTIRLILERWKAKDVLSVDYSTGTKRYKLAKMPAPFMSLKMDGVTKMKLGDSKKLIAEIEVEFPNNGAESIVEPKGKIGNYKTLEITFSNIDPLLGGTPVDGETEFKLHRNADNTPIISPAQMRGWFRENLRLLEINPNAHSWMCFTDAVPTSTPILTKVSAPIVIKGKGGCGLGHYEAFDRGNTFKTIIRVPLNGVGFKSTDDIKRLFDMTEECPKRGLGANPFYLGGKIKLEKLETK